MCRFVNFWCFQLVFEGVFHDRDVLCIEEARWGEFFSFSFSFIDADTVKDEHNSIDT